MRLSERVGSRFAPAKNMSQEDLDREAFMEKIVSDLLTGDADQALKRLEGAGYVLEDLPL
jgi:hypothetical protein